MVNLKKLVEFVTTSMTATEKHRGSHHAVNLLRAAGVSEGRETWAQGKRRGLNLQLE